MVNESQIQAFLEKTINQGKFHAIIDKEMIEKADAAHRSPSFIPDFNLDYILRKKSVCSGMSVLSAIERVDLLSTSGSNISADRQERLFPDLVLVSRTTGHIIVVEIKRGKQTTREAMTELIAYEQEIRNQLPFLSNYQIGFIIASSDFPTLLSHAIGQAILWQGKQVLALEVTEANGSLGLRAVLPLGWSSTRLNYVPEHCFLTTELSVIPNQPEDSEALEALGLDMPHLIAREGERMGSHGFVLASHDHSAANTEQHADVYTIAVICPTLMLHEMIACSDDPESLTPLMNYAVNQGESLSSTYDAFSPLIRPAMEMLSKYGKCQFGKLGNLKSRRADTLPESSMIHRYTPYAMLFWGLPHTYRETLIHQESLAKVFPFLQRLPSFQSPEIGIFALDLLTSRCPFLDGEFEYQGLWLFGRSVGSCLAVLKAIVAESDNQLPQLDASLSWLRHEVISGICEIVFRVQGANCVSNPPALKWGGSESAVQTFEMLNTWVKWFRESFLAGHESHCSVFDDGVTLYPVFDAYLGAKIGADERVALMERAESCAKKAYSFARTTAIDEAHSEKCRARIRTIVQKAGLPFDDDGNTVVPQSTWIQALPALLSVYDEVLPSVRHELVPADLSGVDWEWIKQEVRKSIASGNRAVGVTICAGGQLEVSDLSHIDGPIPVIMDHATEVLFVIEHSGHISTIMRVKWADIISGKISK